GDRAGRRLQLPDADRGREIVGGPRRKDGKGGAGAQEPVHCKTDRAVSAEHRDDLRPFVSRMACAVLEVLTGRAHTDLVFDACPVELLADLPDPSASLPADGRRIGDHDDRRGNVHPQPPRPVPTLGEPPATSSDSLSVLAYLFQPVWSNVVPESKTAFAWAASSTLSGLGELRARAASSAACWYKRSPSTISAFEEVRAA